MLTALTENQVCGEHVFESQLLKAKNADILISAKTVAAESHAFNYLLFFGGLFYSTHIIHKYALWWLYYHFNWRVQMI